MKSDKCPPQLAEKIRTMLLTPQDKEILHASRIARELKQRHRDLGVSEADLSRLVADEAARLGVNIEMDVPLAK